MSRKERERLMVLKRVKDHDLTRREGAVVLGVSLRQMHRIYLRYQDQGDVGLVHKARGKASTRRMTGEREKTIALYRSTYRGFGPTLLSEKLQSHGIWISHDSARRWLMGEGLMEKPRRERRSRRRRVRKERFGQMLQMDGSHHAWFEDRGARCCLMVIVDDATGRQRGRFYPGETLEAAMDLFERWCQEHGLPQSLYVDRAGIYRCDREPTTAELKSRKSPVTQFGRAMKELDVRLILARSPQAKGRVERANGTLQDRLVKEMRLAKITSIEQANAWLARSRFFDDLNRRFSVEPTNDVDAHRPRTGDLKQILCIKEKRKVSHDQCVQFNGQTLQLTNAKPGLRQVDVWHHPDGSDVRLLAGGQTLMFKPYVAPPKAKPVIKNNKMTKPGERQQIRLPGSNPRRQNPPPALRKTG